MSIKKFFALSVSLNIIVTGFLVKNVKETKWLNKVTENSIMNRIESISSEIERFDKERPNVKLCAGRMQHAAGES